MDLESLRCFVAVAESLHFRTAATRIALSPAALSDRIRRLEEELEVPLFTRSTRRVALTDAGRRLLPHARTMLEGADRCASIARGDSRPLPFELMIGTRYELGLSWLAPALPALAQERPERTLHLYMGDTDALLDRLERGSIDAAVLSARLSRPHIKAAVLQEESYAFVGQGAFDPEDAPGLTLVDATPDLPLFHYLRDALPAAAGWRFGRHLYLGGIAAIRLALRDGGGVGVLPRYFVEEDLREGRLVELLPQTPPHKDHFRLHWRRDHPRGVEIERLADSLRALPLI